MSLDICLERFVVVVAAVVAVAAITAAVAAAIAAAVAAAAAADACCCSVTRGVQCLRLTALSCSKKETAALRIRLWLRCCGDTPIPLQSPMAFRFRYKP